jgi:hypothetical protein
MDPIMSQMNPIHILTLYFLNIHFIVILHLCLILTISLSFRFSNENFVSILYLSHASYMPHPPHPD